MIQVPLDKIIPIEEALLDIGKVFDNVKMEKSLYVITKDGKPHSAIIDIGLLEHLPEMESAGATRPIQEIGSNDAYDGLNINRAESQQAPVQPQAPKVETEITQEPSNPAPAIDATAQQAQEEMKDVLSDDIGPWQNDGKPDGTPPDLDI